jgi:hypothetical protein
MSEALREAEEFLRQWRWIRRLAEEVAELERRGPPPRVLHRLPRPLHVRRPARRPRLLASHQRRVLILVISSPR